MSKKQVLFNREASSKLINGVNTLANAVKETLGARGRLVIIEEGGMPKQTKDGVTVANSIDLADPAENMGAQLVKQTAQKTVSVAGDGTTTSIVLAQAIINAGIKEIENGASPVELVNEIKNAALEVIEGLRHHSTPIKEDWDRVYQVAYISMNGDEKHARMLVDAMQKIGEDGAVIISEGVKPETSVEIVKGMEFDCGYNSPLFINAPRNEVVFENPYIFTTTETIETMEQVLSALQVATGKQRPILFICNNSMGEGHSSLIIQRVKGNFPLCVVNAPSYGDKRKDYLMDISAVTGSTLLGPEFGRELKTCKEPDLGTCERVVVTKDKTLIIGGSGDKEAVEKRVSIVRTAIDASEDEGEKEFLRKRLAKLTGGQAVIRAGGITPASISELKDRLDDAMHATRCAIEGGIVPGGGTALNKIGKTLKSQLMRDALARPLYQILVNAGIADRFEDLDILPWGKGFNVRTNQEENFMDSGVIDATKVCISALENAVDVASLILLNNVVITSEYNPMSRQVKRFEMRAE